MKPDTTYGHVANGFAVGSGVDVTIRREDTRTALVNVIHLASGGDYLGEIEIDSETDLQALALDIGNQGLGFFSGERLSSNEDDAWDDLADRWNDLLDQ